ncbi:Uma2 family endonuclease [Clostridium perfringens]|uniref:Uma2 family endonuclease n=1 Tax=Clostridium perfringens TaxID=1502 RepID=UPI0039E8799E
MGVPNTKIYTLDEYNKLRESSEDLYEFIDGDIIKLWSPSTMHQTVALNLGMELKKYFSKGKCKVMLAPYDVFLCKDNKTDVVIPDISVMCDKSGFDDKRYKGVPTLIVEILSSNVSDDTVRKFNLYLKYGVIEYWIIDPKNKTFQIHTYDELNKTYVSHIQEDYSVLNSNFFDNLSIDMNLVFEEI